MSQRPVRPVRLGVAGVGVVVLLATGCGAGGGGVGAGQPDRIGNVTEYDAAVEAKTILSDESIDESSIAYGKVLMVDKAVIDTIEGHRAWKVSFETLDGEPSDICIWLWLSNTAAFHEEYTYAIDRCPTNGTA